MLPDVPAPQIDGLKLERLTVAAGDDEIAEQIGKIAAQSKRHEAAARAIPRSRATSSSWITRAP